MYINKFVRKTAMNRIVRKTVAETGIAWTPCADAARRPLSLLCIAAAAMIENTGFNIGFGGIGRQASELNVEAAHCFFESVWSSQPQDRLAGSALKRSWAFLLKAGRRGMSRFVFLLLGCSS